MIFLPSVSKRSVGFSVAALVATGELMFDRVLVTPVGLAKKPQRCTPYERLRS